MSLPIPQPGMVISYAYLWSHEYEQGLEEGRKDRPCVIILAVEEQEGKTIVTVAPVTHTPPSHSDAGLEIPARVKSHLALDHARSWVVLDELNHFIWPGYDLRPIPGCNQEYVYGFLPPRLFDMIRQRILAQAPLIVERD